jgi:hypothetical protein
MNEYWKVSLEELLDEHGIVATEELIKDIIVVREMESEGCGYINIPNPENTEIQDLKNKIKQLVSEHSRQIEGIRKGVAQRRNVEPSDVSIDSDGNIIYYP